MINTENLEQFYWWMAERHSIYVRKSKGDPAPWTDDPILQKYKFTNVFRELDRVTIWIRENWREPYADHHNLWFAMMACRQINHPETLQEIGFPDFAEHNTRKREEWYEDAIEVAKKRKEAGKLVYGHAYMIRGQTVPWIQQYNRRDKMHYTTYCTLENGWKVGPPTKEDNLESYCKKLAAADSWGMFTAFEVVTDLRHTRYLKDANDLMTWANTGPGAKRGLKWIFPEMKMTEDKMLAAMIFLLQEAPRYMPRKFPKLELRDIEHSLCEFHKYKRGYSKQQYKGTI